MNNYKLGFRMGMIKAAGDSAPGLDFGAFTVRPETAGMVAGGALGGGLGYLLGPKKKKLLTTLLGLGGGAFAGHAGGNYVSNYIVGEKGNKLRKLHAAEAELEEYNKNRWKKGPNDVPGEPFSKWDERRRAEGQAIWDRIKAEQEHRKEWLESDIPVFKPDQWGPE